jgi:hypothetical protein
MPLDDYHMPGVGPLYSLCLRCGQSFDGECCPRCDPPAAPPSTAPAPDPRAVQAWEELKAQGLPVPAQPWTQVEKYYTWVEQHNGPSIYDGWGTVEPADLARMRRQWRDEEASRG